MHRGAARAPASQQVRHGEAGPKSRNRPGRSRAALSSRRMRQGSVTGARLLALSSRFAGARKVDSYTPCGVPPDHDPSQCSNPKGGPKSRSCPQVCVDPASGLVIEAASNFWSATNPRARAPADGGGEVFGLTIHARQASPVAERANTTKPMKITAEWVKSQPRRPARATNAAKLAMACSCPGSGSSRFLPTSDESRGLWVTAP